MGGKRKTPVESKKERMEKKEGRRRPVSMEGASPVERPSQKDPVSKALSIEQGPGTKLKDIIPNKEKREVPGESKEERVEKEGRRRSVSREGASPVERPSRERKKVKRYTDSSPWKVPVSKVLSVEQGPGTKLKDIPNVFSKLSKRRCDENLQVLHTILFGRKSNVQNLKKNIFQFSGFVWAGNEEKQRARVKEKLDKCLKDKLLDFCDLLDIQIVRSTTKKEEVTEKLLQFLESPHAPRDVVLAEKVKKHKGSLETEVKKVQRRSVKAKKEDDESGLVEKEDEDESGSTDEEDACSAEKNNTDSEEESDNVTSENEDEEDETDASSAEKDNTDSEEESDNVTSENEDEEDETEEPIASRVGSAGPKVKEKSLPVKKDSLSKSDKSPLKPVSKKDSVTKDGTEASVQRKPASSKRGSSKSSEANTEKKAASVNTGSLKTPKSISKSSRKSVPVDDSGSGQPSSSKPKKETRKKDRSNEKKAGKKQAAKPVSKVSTKEHGKGKVRPSEEELHDVVSEILEEADFSKITLGDIIGELGVHFNTDLKARQDEVKKITHDVIRNMPGYEEDEEGAEDDEDNEEVEGDEDVEGDEEDEEDEEEKDANEEDEGDEEDEEDEEDEDANEDSDGDGD